MKNKGIWVGVIVVIVVVFFLLIVLNFDRVYSPPEEKEELIEVEREVIFVAETREAAKARQIITLYDEVEIENLQDLKDEGLCTIEFPDETIYSNELGKADFTFEEDLVGEKVKLSCDQFERFGISGDELLIATVTSETGLNEKIKCDYGAVTTPTVYFWFVSSMDLKKDYCVAPLSVLPLEENEGECFDEDTIQAMKDECEEKEKPYYSIPDANGCETIYCGWVESQNLCPAESLLEEAKEQCEAEGNTAVRYSEEVAGQDFPCAQIRCSQCPNDEELDAERDSCRNQGGEPITEMDHDTGCNYIYCAAPGEENEESGEGESGEEEESEDEPEHGEDEIPEGGEDFGGDGPPPS